MTELATAWMLGCTTGFFLGVTVAGWSRPASLRDRRSLPDWRRSINHENTNMPSGPPPLVLRRRGSNPPPSRP